MLLGFTAGAPSRGRSKGKCWKRCCGFSTQVRNGTSCRKAEIGSSYVLRKAMHYNDPGLRPVGVRELEFCHCGSVGSLRKAAEITNQPPLLKLLESNSNERLRVSNWIVQGLYNYAVKETVLITSCAASDPDGRVARYLHQLDSADRQEPSVARDTKTKDLARRSQWDLRRASVSARAGRAASRRRSHTSPHQILRHPRAKG